MVLKVLCVFLHFTPLFLRDLEFEDEQKAHQQSQLQILHTAHQNIVDIMMSIHNIFANDGPEVFVVSFCHSCPVDAEMFLSCVFKMYCVTVYLLFVIESNDEML